MKRKGNTSVPYGSGYKKVDENNKLKLSEKPLKIRKKSKMKVKKPSAKSRLMKMNRRYYLKPEKARQELKKSGLTGNVVGKKIGKQKLFFVSYHKPNINIFEQSEIKKVIGVFGGRFQPFHSGHLATYKWLSKQVDEAYITTSNIKKPPTHPMDFKEKVLHMVKVGVPKNRIVQEKTPYVAVNL